MTGLEPHPVFRLPTQEEARAMGPDRFGAVILERARRMQLELDDPLEYGYKPPIWHVADELLEDGKEVVLIDPAWDVEDPAIRRIRPPDFLKEAVRRRELGLGPVKITGRRELFISGANGASKSEYAARKLSRILQKIPKALTWAFHETEKESIDRQQPLFVRYLPPKIRQIVLATGRYKQGAIANVSWTQKNGFTEKSFVLPSGSQHTFKFYKQEEQTVEGAQLHGAWCDELVPLELISTLRFRLMKHRGILLITFTPIKGWTPSYQEYAEGSNVLLEVDASRLPIKDKTGQETGEFEKVPRVAIAGPGSLGNLKANILWMHSDDNLFLDKKELDEVLRGATRQTVLERGYGVATKAFANQFPRFNRNVHVIGPDRIPKEGTDYHYVDPCEGRNWFQIWLRVDPRGRMFVRREWPSYGHPAAYLPGIGEMGPWALPGAAADGKPGPAQDPLGWTLSQYAAEIDRLEERPALPEGSQGSISNFQRRMTEGEKIADRWMDSRAGNRPTQSKDHYTTLIEQMADLDFDFRPASGQAIGEGVSLINNALGYDDQVPIGVYSPTLARVNEPMLFVSSECPNLIYALQNWTGKDGLKGACKDPVDVLRYAMESEPIYIGNEQAAFVKGGAY
jgi:phage terminase large subunit-like protein